MQAVKSLEKTVKSLQEENGPIEYAIGVLGVERSRWARRALETIAERTGGITFLAKTAEDEVDEILQSSTKQPL